MASAPCQPVFPNRAAGRAASSSRARIEHLQDRRVGGTQSLPVGNGKHPQNLVEAAPGWRVEPLKQGPVRRKWQGHRLVGYFR
jgi:hypothetical protein